MGAGGGALVAAIAAAHAKRLQDVLDRFRVAGATSADRAKTLDDLSLNELRSEVGEHETRGVLVTGKRPGTWYLDEAAYVEHRDRRRGRKLGVIIVLLFLLTLLLVLGVIVIGR